MFESASETIRRSIREALMPPPANGVDASILSAPKVGPPRVITRYDC